MRILCTQEGFEPVQIPLEYRKVPLENRQEAFQYSHRLKSSNVNLHPIPLYFQLAKPAKTPKSNI